MSKVLPILFNGDMVRAILDGRKTVTRRAVKYKYSNTEMKVRTDKYGTGLIEIQKDIEGETHGKNPDGSTWHKLLPYIEKNPPYKKGISYMSGRHGLTMMGQLMALYIRRDALKSLLKVKSGALLSICRNRLPVSGLELRMLGWSGYMTLRISRRRE